MAWRLLAALALAAWAVLPARADGPLAVGAVVSLTGPDSARGAAARDALILVQEELNAKGGIGGRQISLEVLDDGSDPKAARLAMEEILKDGRVAAIIGPTSEECARTVADQAAKAGVPLLSLAILGRDQYPVNPWVFTVAPSASLFVGHILAHAKLLGLRKIAVATSSDRFGRAGREALRDLIPASGLALVADEVFEPGDQDMAARMARIASVAPEAAVFWGRGLDWTAAAGEWASLGGRAVVYLGPGAHPGQFKTAGSMAEKIFTPAGPVALAVQAAGGGTPGVQARGMLAEYVEAYGKRYGREPRCSGGYAFDAMRLLGEAARRSGSTAPDGLREGLEKVSGFAGVSGVFSFSATDHQGLDGSSLSMARIEDGHLVLMNE